MTDKREAAMRQALEALKVVWNEHPAIDALTAALKQPTTGIKQVIELYDSPEQLAPVPEAHKQEPVAWGWALMHSDGTCAVIRPRIDDFFGSIQESDPYTSEDAKHADREWAGLAPHTIVTLYTSPPAQRTWVGLTEDEIKALWESSTGKKLPNMGSSIWQLLAVARAIEDKLKEKNNG